MVDQTKMSISQKVSLLLEQRIAEGEYAVGEKLPTEQEICEEFDVGRSSAREAVRMLQAKGYVEVRRGSGTYVVSAVGMNSDSISSWLLDNSESLRDYMDVRLAIEVLASRLFIKRLTPQKLADLEKALHEFNEAVASGDTARMTLMDGQFHKVIVDGTENELLMSINQLLNESFHKYRQITFRNAGSRDDAVDAHYKIFNSISRRDTNDAVFNIQEHLIVSVDNAIKSAQKAGAFPAETAVTNETNVVAQ